MVGSKQTVSADKAATRSKLGWVYLFDEVVSRAISTEHLDQNRNQALKLLDRGQGQADRATCLEERGLLATRQHAHIDTVSGFQCGLQLRTNRADLVLDLGDDSQQALALLAAARRLDQLTIEPGEILARKRKLDAHLRH
jgi:hypothetical protein